VYKCIRVVQCTKERIYLRHVLQPQSEGRTKRMETACCVSRMARQFYHAGGYSKTVAVPFRTFPTPSRVV
jgi:hypothetical protein